MDSNFCQGFRQSMNVKISLEVDVSTICKLFSSRYGVTLFAVRSIGKGSRILLNPGPNHKMSTEDRCFYIAISSEEDTAFKAYKEPKKPVSLFKGSFRHKNDSFITASSVALELNTDSVEAGNTQKSQHVHVLNYNRSGVLKKGYYLYQNEHTKMHIQYILF